MKKRLCVILWAITFILLFASCNRNTVFDESTDKTNQATENILLEESQDFGRDYIDSLIFMGESTTYHLKSRGVLNGGTKTNQVWAPKSGTLKLDMNTKSAKIVYPESGKELTLYECALIKKPEYIVFTFGLNGAVQNINLGEKYFKSCYTSIIKEVLKASPKTKIILQSAFPVGKNMNMENYSISSKTLNSYIEKENIWAKELAEKENLRYLDTSKILKDEEGFLKEKYASPDGYHLTKDAYNDILYYIRTHGYK